MFIYCIENKINGKKYYGQTIQLLCKRWGDHKKLLNSDNHPNCHLQRAWVKYGSENFLFYLVEKCDTLTRLNELEEYYISKNKGGYNIKMGGLNRKHSDETKKKMSLSQKSRKNRKKINPIWLHNELNSKKRQLAKIPNGKYPQVVSPNGKIYTFSNLKKFCNEHELSASGMRFLMEGKYKTHKGWYLINTPIEQLDKGANCSKIKRPQGYPDLISPNGTIYSGITSMNRFKNEHGLSSSGLSYLINGKVVSYKGWTIKTV